MAATSPGETICMDTLLYVSAIFIGVPALVRAAMHLLFPETER